MTALDLARLLPPDLFGARGPGILGLVTSAYLLVMQGSGCSGYFFMGLQAPEKRSGVLDFKVCRITSFWGFRAIILLTWGVQGVVILLTSPDATTRNQWLRQGIIDVAFNAGLRYMSFDRGLLKGI